MGWLGDAWRGLVRWAAGDAIDAEAKVRVAEVQAAADRQVATRAAEARAAADALVAQARAEAEARVSDAMLAAEQERQWRGTGDLRDEFTAYEGGLTVAEAARAIADPVARSSRLAEADTFAQIAKDDRGWNAVGAWTKDVTSAQLRELQRQSRFLFYRHPLARNIIRTWTSMVCGKGATLQFRDKADQARWDEWARVHNWRRLHKQVVRDSLIYGEDPLVFFPLSEHTKIEPDPGDKVTRRGPADLPRHVRTFDPLQIDRLETAPEDSEDVRGVVRSFVDAGGTTRTYTYAPQDIILVRNDTVGEGSRGRPRLEPVLRQLTWYDNFVRDRVVLNGMRTRLPIVRKVELSGTSAVQGEGGKVTQLWRPASVLTVGKGEEWTFPSMNIGGGDAAPDGRMILLLICAGVNLPEFLVAMNADTGNRASLQEAMDGLEPYIDEQQATYADPFEDLGERIIGARPTCVWPIVDKRDIYQQVQALSQALADGALSRRMYATKLGNNYDQVVADLRREQAQRAADGLIPSMDHTPEPAAAEEEAGEEEEVADTEAEA